VPGPIDTKELPAGQRVRNTQTAMFGVILDSACQYAHPKAAPVYSYLIRWEDGQVQALTEAAFSTDYGVELVD
jgi:hypothetical protein